MNYQRILSSVALVVGALLFSVGLQAFAVFSPPTAAPPNADAYAPLNTSPNAQEKEGGLLLNTGGAINGLIVQSGNVGIGTANPARLLHVNGGSSLNKLYVNGDEPSGYAVITSENSPGVAEGSGLPLMLKSSGGQSGALTILPSGNVGIGTAVPNAKLELSGNSQASWPAASAMFTDTGASGIKYALGSRNGYGFSISDETNLAFRFVVSPTGNVGIGTTNPKAKLDVTGDLKIGNSGATCSSQNEGAIRYDTSVRNLQFCNGTAWAAITSTVPASAPTPPPAPPPAPVCSVPTVTNHGSGCMQWNTCTGNITSSVSGSCQYNFGCANPGGNGWMNDVLITACTAEYGGTLAATGYWNWTCTIGASCKGGGFDADCSSNGGTPITTPDGTGARICVFSAASCPVYYSQYQNWSTTQSVSPDFNGPPWWWGGTYSDPGCSTPTGSCTTGGHTWGNAGLESCSASAYTNYGYGCDYYSSATAYASRTQIGCVR